MNWVRVHQIIERALDEDLGNGDLTTDSIVPPSLRATATLYAKAAGVIAGLEVFSKVFRLLDESVEVHRLANDGDPITPGQKVAKLEGNARWLLMGERVALNLLQRMSGIATETAKVVELVKPFGTTVCDTRKTAPGLRILDKYAVRMGGGRNHRFGLDDAVLVKDNHIAVAGGIAQAVESARQSVGHAVKLEVEVTDVDQLEQAIACGVDCILLDNMPAAEMARAVRIAAGRAVLEASGGVTPQNIVEIAKTGVDVISLGWLTHSAPALDLSMKIEMKAGGEPE